MIEIRLLAPGYTTAESLMRQVNACRPSHAP